MTPAARHAAAIEILDDWLAGGALEQVLTRWARGNRFAGSKDRAAIRDIVYDAVRCRRSFAALGGSETGRGLVIGGLRAGGLDPATLFTGEGYAPLPLTEEEMQPPDVATLPEAVRMDLPDWLMEPLRASLGDDLAPVAETLRHRAPVHLRVNIARIGRAAAIEMLAGDGVRAEPNALSETALTVTEGARRVHLGRAYRDGLVELQDAASQAVVDMLGVYPGCTVLDYCAGGGGKALALAARGAHVTAHDIDPRRMSDLPGRADRAGVNIEIAPPDAVNGLFDLVLADAPCSGSGSWRRAPQGKWSLSEASLGSLQSTQADILDRIAGFVSSAGRIAYATCSLLDAENDEQIAAFLARNGDWHVEARRRFTPLDGGDGFFIATLARAHNLR
ncbi:RsmB/NOP family class I SAM-dependent RNA methyltransferase [Maritimibacter sp. UBA3975]|uniref:RsmB/NOP family class I SAM-dependent RNA methyltransferase n=1 Tax=Maritimibacter sp. UBA3975 TaxID=1946833 RepID=UPI000C0930BE|nr:RsmB/NOP family class I SAM-dependent RNA methyltransferase [Maritimibacter sp. UBA3975]MAM60467.1 SAM-dependent methyltransferase [Maritimibacter sp.]|tara:strand:- start:21962 stop:23134 length:1173 start_codon:yes stop_codon:yes gene_type:complete